MNKYKIIKRLILFFSVLLTTIIFSIELQHFTPDLLAGDDFSSLGSEEELSPIPAEETFIVEDEKLNLPKQKKDIKKLIKDTLRIQEEVSFKDIEIKLMGEKSKTVVCDLTFHIKSEEALNEFRAVQDNVKEETVEILSTKEEADFSGYALLRLKDEIVRKANSHFKQYVVTRIRFDKIELR